MMSLPYSLQADMGQEVLLILGMSCRRMQISDSLHVARPAYNGRNLSNRDLQQAGAVAGSSLHV